MSIKTYTPASIASWESSLEVRSQLCLSVAGINDSKLTLYAGPRDNNREPAGILTITGRGTFISRPPTKNVELWITELLQAATQIVTDQSEGDNAARAPLLLTA